MCKFQLNIVLFLFCSGLLFARIPEVIRVTTDRFELDIDAQIVALSQNVNIKTEAYKFESGSARLDLEDNQISIENDFIIHYGDQQIFGKRLILNNEASALTANQVQLNFHKYTLIGDEVFTKGSEVHMRHVQVSSCQSDQPLFYLRSGHLTIYPAFGFLVAFNSLIYVGGLPVLYFPAYFIGDRRYSAFAKNSLIPEIGSNQVEGWYIKEFLPYFINSKNSGLVMLGYLEKFGMKAGIRHFHLLNDQNRLAVSAFYNQHFWQGGVDFTSSLFSEYKQDQYFLSFLFSDSGRRKSNLYLNIRYYWKEFLNHQFVDQLPQVSLTGKVLLAENHEIAGDLSFADLRENTLTQDRRIRFSAALTSRFQLGRLYLTNYLSYEQNRYGESDQNLEYAYDRIRLDFPIDPLQLFVGTEHVLNYTGSSPFVFDAYEVDPNDRFIYGFRTLFSFINFEYSAKQAWSGAFYHRRIELSIPYQQCIDFRVYYEDVRQELGLSFKI